MLLPAPFGPDQAMQLAGRNREIDVGRYLQAAEALVELPGFEQRHQAPARLNMRGNPASAVINPCGASSTVNTSARPITTSAYWLP